MIATGKIRYFSLQIQNTFTKFVDKAKKVFTLVIRALALTNMPVIKDMSPTFTEKTASHITNFPAMDKEKEELTRQLSEKDTILSEKDKELAEAKDEAKKLSDQLTAIKQAEHDKYLSEQVEKLCLSSERATGFKGGEKEKVLAFVKTLSEEQAKAYFALHEEIVTSVDEEAHGSDESAPETDSSEDAATAELSELVSKRMSEKNLSYRAAFDQVLSEKPDLARGAY